MPPATLSVAPVPIVTVPLFVKPFGAAITSVPLPALSSSVPWLSTPT